MTTIKERFKAVKNKTLRKQLLDAYDKEFVGGCEYAGCEYADTDAKALYSGFAWIHSKKGYNYWFQLYSTLCKVNTFDEAWPVFASDRGGESTEEDVVDKDARIKQLESAIRKTIRENKHLADGENCTLIHLKKALKGK
jgi:hypothetical protein